MYLLCGYESIETRADLSDEQKKDQTTILTSIHEQPKWKWFVNVNALILMTIAIVLWGYYA